jgi:hypothetical protein
MAPAPVPRLLIFSTKKQLSKMIIRRERVRYRKRGEREREREIEREKEREREREREKERKRKNEAKRKRDPRSSCERRHRQRGHQWAMWHRKMASF